MNRSALKSAGFVLLGVVLGCAIGRPPWWSGETGTGSGRLRESVMDGGATARAGYGAGLAGSGGGAGTGKPSSSRLGVLVDSFRQKSGIRDEMAADVAVITEAAGMAVQEFGPLIALLEEDNANRKTIQLLAIRWAALDPVAAAAFMLSRPKFKSDWPLMAIAVQGLAKTDLPAAKEVVWQLDDGVRQDAGKALMRMIQENDAHAALTFARELGDERAEADVLIYMAESDPLAAAAELTPGSEDQRRAVDLIASKLLKQDRKAFEAWAGSLRDPGDRAAARSVELGMGTMSDPKGTALATAAWLAAEPAAAAPNELLAERIVYAWLRSESRPSEVAAWAGALPEGKFKDRATSALGGMWPEEDPMGASAWAASLPPGAARDNAVCTFVERIRYETPADAFEWALTVRNPSMRHGILMSTLSYWAAKDAAAAQAAVESLPVGDRDYLLEALKEREKSGG